MKSTWLSQLSMLQHREVQDLAWAALSPPLLENMPQLPQLSLPEDPARLWQWLLQLDQQPAALLKHLNQHPRRLGLYFEALWQFLLWQAPLFNTPCRLLAHNLPVYQQQIKGRHTLGAFDFVLQRGTQLLPLEITVKFYLGVPTLETHPGDWHAWPGPDSRDSAAEKFQHMAQQQLLLANTAAGQATLQAAYPTLTIAPAACLLKGYFFYPANGNMNPPQRAHPAHLRGQWWYADHFVATPSSNRFLFLPKFHWLAPAIARNTEPQHKADVWRALMASQQHEFPVMLAEMQQRAGRWHECNRHCVVPAHWPHLMPR